jgi:hypothetical protein
LSTSASRTASQRDLVDLLERAGYHIRGRRADCIHCEGHSRLTVSFNDEVAYCHRCHWTGNARTITRELGLPVTPETREEREERARVEQFSQWVNTCHSLIIRHVRYLTSRGGLAKKILAQFPDCESAWAVLAEFYDSESILFAALDVLSFEKVSPWLESPMTRETLFAAYADAGGRIGARNAA